MSSQGTRGAANQSLSCLSYNKEDFKDKPLNRGVSLPREAPHFAFLQNQELGITGNKVQSVYQQKMKG